MSRLNLTKTAVHLFALEQLLDMAHAIALEDGRSILTLRIPVDMYCQMAGACHEAATTFLPALGGLLDLDEPLEPDEIQDETTRRAEIARHFRQIQESDVLPALPKPRRSR